MSQLPLKVPAPPQGVIAALVTGFETVNARLELILLPLALDLFLWLGPHLSIQRLVPQVEQTLRLVLAPASSDAAGQRNLQIFVEGLHAFGATFNVFSILSTAPLGLPSLLANRSPVVSPLGAPVVFYVDSLPQYLLLVGAFTLLGLFLAALYFGSIAQQVRDRRLSASRLLRQVWGDWARLTALGALALLVGIGIGMPLSILIALVYLFSPLVAGLVLMAGLTVLLWMLFYAGFTVHAMFLQRRGLLLALWDSARLVQFNLPHTASLFLLVVLIYVGLAELWKLPPDASWLLLLGVGGHALISTALIAATFVFYQDRYRWWTEMRQTQQTRAQADKRGLKRKV